MKFVYVFAFILLISAVGVAQNNTGEFQISSYTINQSIDYRGVCFNNSDTCTSDFQCSLTIYDPTDDLVFLRENMSFISDGQYNYTIPAQNISEVGLYYGYMRCVDSTNTDRVRLADASFRSVPQLLYDGGGFLTWELSISLGVLIISIFSAYIATRMDFWAYQFGFIIISLFLITADITILMNIAALRSQPAIFNILEAMLIGFVGLTFFFTVIFIWKLFTTVMENFKNIRIR